MIYWRQGRILQKFTPPSSHVVRRWNWEHSSSLSSYSSTFFRRLGTSDQLSNALLSFHNHEIIRRDHTARPDRPAPAPVSSADCSVCRVLGGVARSFREEILSAAGRGLRRGAGVVFDLIPACVWSYDTCPPWSVCVPRAIQNCMID